MVKCTVRSIGHKNEQNQICFLVHGSLIIILIFERCRNNDHNFWKVRKMSWVAFCTKNCCNTFAFSEIIVLLFSITNLLILWRYYVKNKPLYFFFVKSKVNSLIRMTEFFQLSQPKIVEWVHKRGVGEQLTLWKQIFQILIWKVIILDSDYTVFFFWFQTIPYCWWFPKQTCNTRAEEERPGHPLIPGTTFYSWGIYRTPGQDSAVQSCYKAIKVYTKWTNDPSTEYSK